jgi:alpha-amylase
MKPVITGIYEVIENAGLYSTRELNITPLK